MITRILDAVGIRDWKCKKRPYLTEEAVTKRLASFLPRNDWTVEDFRKHVLSNVYSVERGAQE